MKQARVGLVIQLWKGPEFGPDPDLDALLALDEALADRFGRPPSGDSGSRTTNVYCWDIPPEGWDEALRDAVKILQARGLADRALIARLDYVEPDDEDEEIEWGEERVVWPAGREGSFEQWPEWRQGIF